MKNVVVTGVSTGIGYALVKELLDRGGYRVFGSVRKQADVDRLRADFGDGFVPLLFDVTDEDGVKTAVSQIKQTIGNDSLHALVNNAGISTPGPLLHMPIDDVRFQMEVNVIGLLNITQQLLPLLGATTSTSSVSAHAPGRIINISSVSGKVVYPFMGAYAASKHAVEAISDALRRELMMYGIDVIVVEPGTTRTPIVGKFAEQVGQYADTDYGRMLSAINASIDERERNAIPVERVVDAIIDGMEKPNPKSRYAVPRKRWTGWIIPRLLPDRWFDKMIAKKLPS